MKGSWTSKCHFRPLRGPLGVFALRVWKELGENEFHSRLEKIGLTFSIFFLCNLHHVCVKSDRKSIDCVANRRCLLSSLFVFFSLSQKIASVANIVLSALWHIRVLMRRKFIAWYTADARPSGSNFNNFYCVGTGVSLWFFLESILDLGRKYMLFVLSKSHYGVKTEFKEEITVLGEKVLGCNNLWHFYYSRIRFSGLLLYFLPFDFVC